MKSRQLRTANKAKTGFTGRQVETTEMIAQGRTDKEIAQALGISDETVAHHLRVMFREHAVHSRAALVAKLAAPPR